jgi:hypothetical protein
MNRGQWSCGVPLLVLLAAARIDFPTEPTVDLQQPDDSRGLRSCSIQVIRGGKQ